MYEVTINITKNVTLSISLDSEYEVGTRLKVPVQSTCLTDDPIWRSSDTSVATISNYGFLVVLAPGTVTITASYEGIESEATFTAIPEKYFSIKQLSKAYIGKTYQISC